MNETYATPQSELVTPTGTEGQTLEAGITGNYQMSISEVLSQSWNNTKGTKRYIIGAGIIMYAVTIVAIMILGAVLGLGGELPGAMMFVSQMMVQLVIMAIMIPFAGGIFIIAMKRLQNEQIEFSDAFSAFGKTVPLVIAAIVMNIAILIGFLLFIIPGIYLSFAYMLTIPLIVDRDMQPWEAMEASRKAVTKNWFKFFFLWIVMFLILIVSMIPAGLGLIWTMPMMAVMIAVCYKTVFGIKNI